MITPADPVPSVCQWRSIAGILGYEVSEYGHVRRATDSPSGNAKAGRIIRPSLSSNGYYNYGLSQDASYRYVSAHRLVALNFIGEPLSSSHQVAHNDGVRSNCHYSNLRWATAKENSADRIIHGTHKSGENHPSHLKPWTRPRGQTHCSAKLTDAEVLAIRSDTGYRNNGNLARQYGVDPALIRRIKMRVIWRHLP